MVSVRTGKINTGQNEISRNQMKWKRGENCVEISHYSLPVIYRYFISPFSSGRSFQTDTSIIRFRGIFENKHGASLKSSDI